MFVHLMLPKRSLRLLPFIWIIVSLFCSALVIFTILSSRSLIHSSASVILLMIPSWIFLISVFLLLFFANCLFLIYSRSLLNISCIFSICASILFICIFILFPSFGSSLLSLLWSLFYFLRLIAYFLFFFFFFFFLVLWSYHVLSSASSFSVFSFYLIYCVWHLLSAAWMVAVPLIYGVCSPWVRFHMCFVKVLVVWTHACVLVNGAGSFLSDGQCYI